MKKNYIPALSLLIIALLLLHLALSLRTPAQTVIRVANQNREIAPLARLSDQIIYSCGQRVSRRGDKRTRRHEDAATRGQWLAREPMQRGGISSSPCPSSGALTNREDKKMKKTVVAFLILFVAIAVVIVLAPTYLKRTSVSAESPAKLMIST